MSRTQCFAEKRGSTWRGRDADGRLRSTSGYPTRNKALQAARGARRRLHTILADAVTAGHLDVNPATRQRGRGRKASQDRARITAEKIWATEDAALLLAERCGLLGGEAEFIRVLLIAFTGLRWGEVNGLQASYIRGPDRRRNHFYIRVEWQMIELNGKFYLAPPKGGLAAGRRYSRLALHPPAADQGLMGAGAGARAATTARARAGRARRSCSWGPRPATPGGRTTPPAFSAPPPTASTRRRNAAAATTPGAGGCTAHATRSPASRCR